MLAQLAVLDAQGGEAAVPAEGARRRSGFRGDGQGRRDAKRWVVSEGDFRGEEVAPQIDIPREQVGWAGVESPRTVDSVDGFPSLRTAQIAQGYAKMKLDL